MRLFVAMPVQQSALPAISQSAQRLCGCMGVRQLPASSWHLTLCFIGDADEEKAKRIEHALGQVKFAPFGVHLFGAGAYPNSRFPRAIYVGGESPGAVALAAEVGKALLPFGIQKEKFSVHVTVARSKGAADIGMFLEKTGEVCSFWAERFVLMKSRLLPGGAAYEVLREYPAEGQA